MSAEGKVPEASEAPVASEAAEAAEVAEAAEDVTVRDPVSAPGADGVPRRATRRFPLFTRDTARPEGGGRAAPVTRPRPPGSGRSWPCCSPSAWACC